MLERFSIRANELARFGLFAMVLLTFGPLVGQLNAASYSSSSDALWICGEEQFDFETQHSGTHDHVWYEQCEYCSLVQHFPFLASYTPDIARHHLAVAMGAIELERSGFYSEALFLHAPKRAPPTLNS